MSMTVKELTKRRNQADQLAEKWAKKTQDAIWKMSFYRARSKRLTTIIEKRLAEKQTKPKDPTRVVEV